MRMPVNTTSLMWHFWMLKELNDYFQRGCHIAISYFQSFLHILALPGWDMHRMQICHPCHSNNYGLTDLLCHVLKYLRMTHHSVGKQEVLHLGEEVKRMPHLRTIPFLPKQCYYSHLPGNTQTEYVYHTIRKEDQDCKFTLVFHIWDTMRKRATSKTLFHQPHTQLIQSLTSKHRDQAPFSLFWYISWKWYSLT